MMRPLLKAIATFIVKREWSFDARWVAQIAGTAADLKGLRLSRFDKTVIRNRKLLRSVYFGERAPLEADVVGAHPSVLPRTFGA